MIILNRMKDIDFDRLKTKFAKSNAFMKTSKLFFFICFLLFTRVCFAQGSVQINEQYIKADLFVYESTPSSIIAAVAAATEGLSVVMISPYKHIGGMRTSGLSMHNLGVKDTFGGLGKSFHDMVYQYYIDKYGLNSPQVQSCENGLRFEPHVAEQIFLKWILKAGVRLFNEEYVVDVLKRGPKITQVITSKNRVISADIFIDGSYEGDLLALAGISYRVGRDNRNDFNEKLAGVTYPPGKEGYASNKIQRFVYRLVLTDSVENQIPITRPNNYHRAMFMIDASYMEHKPPEKLGDVLGLNMVPNRKTDVRVGEGWVGGSNGWVSANFKEREIIAQEHKDYAHGYLWFLLTDKSVPNSIKMELRKWGFAKDEFGDNNHWPYQLYVREARRMMGEYVMTESDILTNRFKSDAIAIGSYMLDVHPTQYVPLEEGDYGLYSSAGVLREGGIAYPIKPYEIPYRSLLPKRSEAINLLVTVCVSSSHVAFSSIRMEPVYMMMGHAAGLAAAISIKGDILVHDINYDELYKKLINQKAVLDASIFD